VGARDCLVGRAVTGKRVGGREKGINFGRSVGVFVGSTVGRSVRGMVGVWSFAIGSFSKNLKARRSSIKQKVALSLDDAKREKEESLLLEQYCLSTVPVSTR
jgi:hypothetical protein